MDGRENSKNELQIKLTDLEEEYRLARFSLVVGGIRFFVVVLVVIFTLPWIFNEIQVTEGIHTVLLVGLGAAAIGAYLWFVFRSVAKVRLEISKTKAQLGMERGE